MIKFSEYKERHGVATKVNGDFAQESVLFKAPEIKLSYAKYLSLFRKNRNSILLLALDRLIDDIENDRFDITIGHR